jgi:hypothetical protein
MGATSGEQGASFCRALALLAVSVAHFREPPPEQAVVTTTIPPPAAPSQAPSRAARRQGVLMARGGPPIVGEDAVLEAVPLP